MGPRPSIALCVLALWAAACQSGGGAPDQGPPPATVTDPNALAVVHGQDAFAADLYARLRTREGNLVFSPYSVHEAFSILRLGARQVSAEALDRSLHLPAEGREPGWTVLHRSVRGDGQATLRVGNRLWIDDRFALDAGFAERARAVHDAVVTRRDLGDAEAVVREANEWVDQTTDGMIPEALSTLPPDAVLVLVNAVYFHGRWRHAFERSATTPGPFTTDTGARVDVPLMAIRERFRYQEDPVARTLALPYKGGTTELVLLLPAEADGLPRLEEALDPGALERWTTGGSVAEVDLRLPRFRFESSMDLLPVLDDLGLGDLARIDRADLGGIGSDPRGPLFLSAVSQKAVVELDEEGTKVAAATVALGSCRAPESDPIWFHCTRPFLFVIRHVPTGAILFVGRVVSPPTA